ncbi:MAG: homocysteine S-methyltransferase family protein [Oscillospiraceae bacterium]|nr:homocysteine S-methyltransferase family protein [Oscillospiraceae bacterium]
MNINKAKFNTLLQKPCVIFDGAMGTQLQQRGLKPGEPAELFNFTAPEKVAEVIEAYVSAGADIVSANTFCANRYKLTGTGKTPEEVIFRAIEIAKSAVSHSGTNALVALDCSPIGQLLRPTGMLTFDEAYDIFAQVVRAGVSAGADLIVFQTFSDLLELKAAILAAKENSDLPIITSMTFEESGRTFTGCPVSAYAVTASGLGADIIGVNCSLGPHELNKDGGIVDTLLQFSSAPVMVKPNAGLPDPVTGEFKLSAQDFAAEMHTIAAKGARVLGGCCGTAPEYIRLLSSAVQQATSVQFAPKADCLCVCSGVKTVVVDRPCVIGERINPTGKRLFKEALKNADIDYISAQALEQTHAGADILDVNVGLPEIDEKQMMCTVIERLQSVCELPLQIDSGDPDVIEAALRRYNGKPIVNSVNGKEESLSTILPLVAKYGAAVIALTLDEGGIPSTARERLAIARRITQRATEAGIAKENIIIDCLTMTVSTDAKAALTTLEAVRLIKRDLGVMTALGVSNVSFGLPNRGLLNTAFLTQALYAGLDLPIINPNAHGEMNAVRAARLLGDFDPNAAEYIAATVQTDTAPDTSSTATTATLESAIVGGLKKDAVAITTQLLTATDAMTIVNEQLIPALDKVGADFEGGTLFLPQLILAAETAGCCFDIIKAQLGDNAEQSNDVVILATVQGDIHDIGKNIVKVLLENYGYRIIDLGKDVPPEEIADAAEKHAVKLLGLSALMTTTLPAMSRTIELIRARGLNCSVMVGGAVLNADYAKTIGADYYAKDAKGAVDITKIVFT